MTDTTNLQSRPGVVYVLTNPDFPHLVKIGRTARDAEVRAVELWQTGVPRPFDVYAAVKTIDCVELEAFIHGELKTKRVHRGREFFAVDPEVAFEKLKFWAWHQACEWTRNHFDFVCVEPFSKWVSGGAVERLAEESGQPERLVADALERLTVSEIEPALERAREDREAEHKEYLVAAGIPEEDHWSAFQ